MGSVLVFAGRVPIRTGRLEVPGHVLHPRSIPDFAQVTRTILPGIGVAAPVIGFVRILAGVVMGAFVECINYRRIKFGPKKMGGGFAAKFTILAMETLLCTPDPTAIFGMPNAFPRTWIAKITNIPVLLLEIPMD